MRTVGLNRVCNVTASKASYIQRVSAGMKAKKYKGGEAVKVRNSSNKVFDSYFKPLVAR